MKARLQLTRQQSLSGFKGPIPSFAILLRAGGDTWELINTQMAKQEHLSGKQRAPLWPGQRKNLSIKDKDDKNQNRERKARRRHSAREEDRRRFAPALVAADR